ncbi:facilitated trehalose transporter Tret1-like isoform X2 [Phymastichus coffea]|uniref:facilitated trehalose transporter Tret1-like isoform X2 n=1 Tax=Phymastichus coffea TaxID=108790 RepID=UPI00273AFEA5|nr:facilitated trehalose transporter Tret1-like isoform X2 [Phymastichus coffea]
MAEKHSVVLNAEKTALVDQNFNATIIPMKNGIEKSQAIPKLRKGSPIRQILAALVAQLGTINTGMVFGFSAIAISQMKEADTTLKIDLSEESWIASMSAIGTPIGCLLSGYLMDMLGRKLSLIVTEIPALLGWVLIFYASDVRLIYAGRFFTGLGSGMVGAPARVYTSEVTQPHLRGMLTAISSIGVSTGVLVEYALGAVLHWHICAGISAIVPAAALILMFLFPESPSYLISVNKPEEAKESLQKFRSTSYDLNEEMNTLINFSNKNNIKRLTGFREIISALLKPSALKPFLLLFLYFLIYQWTGTNAVTFYAVDIVKDSGIKLNKYLVTVVLGAVRLASTVAACIACRKYGRRPMTLISSLGCGLFMVGLGAYIWAKDFLFEQVGTWVQWIPVICIMGYTVHCTLGFLVIPWVMIGEIYPVQVRGIVGGLTTMCAHSFIFSVVKTYPMLAEAITQQGTFILYGWISLLGTIYFYLCLPETKNKTLQEIEDYFSGRNDSLETGISSLKSRFTSARKGQALPT